MINMKQDTVFAKGERGDDDGVMRFGRFSERFSQVEKQREKAVQRRNLR